MTRGNLLLNGRYRLADQLAAGGMGEVWKASDELLGRQVAVKVLQHQYAGDPTFRARFRAEAQYTARLTHPGIAQVYDYGEQDDISFLVMELVPGEPLSAILARHRRLTSDVTLDIVGQAARALQSAHSVGLMHRDIKPGNLLVTPDGVVKLTDFGIARAAEAVTLTQTGMVMGTAHYVSPEQAAGKPLTPATDIYSLGVVAYECLAGGPPFTAETVVTVALKHVREFPPPLPPDVPEPVQELVALALEKDPAARPRSADELADRAHVVRETLALGEKATGQSTLPNLLAVGADPPATPGEPIRSDASTAAFADAAMGATDAGADETVAHAADATAGGTPYAYADTAAAASEGEDSRRSRKGPMLALAAVLVLICALVVGAVWRSDGGDDQRHGQRVRATVEASSQGLVPPEASPSPSPPAPQTIEETPDNDPGGDVSARPTPKRTSPTKDEKEPPSTPSASSTGTPSLDSPSPAVSPNSLSHEEDRR